MLVKKNKNLTGDNKPQMLRFAHCLGIDAAITRSIVYSAGIRSAANRGDLRYALKSCVELLHQEIGNKTEYDPTARPSDRPVNSDVFVLCADVVIKAVSMLDAPPPGTTTSSPALSLLQGSNADAAGDPLFAFTSGLSRDLAVFKSVLFNSNGRGNDVDRDQKNNEERMASPRFMVDEIIRLGLIHGPVETLGNFMQARSIRVNGADYEYRTRTIPTAEDYRADVEFLLGKMEKMLGQNKSGRIASSFAFHWKLLLNDNSRSVVPRASLFRRDSAAAVGDHTRPDVMAVAEVLTGLDKATCIVPDIILAAAFALDISNGGYSSNDVDKKVKMCLERLILIAIEEDDASEKSKAQDGKEHARTSVGRSNADENIARRVITTKLRRVSLTSSYRG